MSKSTSIPSSITSTTSDEDLIDILLTMSSNVTNASIIDALNLLPDSSDRMGALVVAASMSIKLVVDKVAQTAAVAVPEAWKVGDSVNFSMFAMAGHLMFMLPESSFTPRGRRSLVAYRKSIGGYSDIVAYGSSGKIPGKTARSEILRNWAERLEGADLAKAESVLSYKFPALVKGSVVSPGVSSLLRKILSPLFFLLGVIERIGIFPTIALLMIFPTFRSLSIKGSILFKDLGLAAVPMVGKAVLPAAYYDSAVNATSWAIDSMEEFKASNPALMNATSEFTHAFKLATAGEFSTAYAMAASSVASLLDLVSAPAEDLSPEFGPAEEPSLASYAIVASESPEILKAVPASGMESLAAEVSGEEIDLN